MRKWFERPAGYEQWETATFDIAYAGDLIIVVRGYQYRGLGIDLRSTSKARYIRKDGTRLIRYRWVVSHLNSGHLVRGLECAPTQAFDLASELAKMSDWTFDGLDGWKNLDPELPKKMAAWHARHRLVARQYGGGLHEGVAREIGARRW